ncbi:hypothetical protein HAX54_002275 [Datura stramonium]|uniref:Uncharacterized protein n=1 Tax=Datura stramonium TaxID=4076 RepID=A0ABS8T553_DATST|nr:hypothetical protein [Datura stramonium]
MSGQKRPLDKGVDSRDKRPIRNVNHPNMKPHHNNNVERLQVLAGNPNYTRLQFMVIIVEALDSQMSWSTALQKVGSLSTQLNSSIS